ncbi:hypothetical protein C922_04641 [Plasmodium inui San Antonio 1]|uniref:Rhodanese domain-containing protein n=1 Tax=Plasmodium inui San Antonio 1 TaxID=1237626 RepID=W7A140_9APIC|nr:hypothetical protein C922_04641 [Plasmodium inui San Antonio 1]EUD65013.1 hypothetical protein C922_04641 [Plasmodium inui San Antonio 1]
MYPCLDFEALKEEIIRERLQGKETNEVDVGARTESNSAVCGFTSGLKSDLKSEIKDEVTKAPQNCSAKEPPSSSKENIEVMYAKMVIKTINATYLYNYFQQLLDQGNNRCLFLVDLQMEREFQMYHITSAVHITNEPLIDKMKKEIGLKQNAKVVFYHTKERVQNDSRYDRLLYSHFANVKANFYFLKGGYKNFEREYCFLCISKNRPNRTLSAISNFRGSLNYPIKFCSNLFVGTLIHITNPFINSHLKIKYVYDFTDSGHEMTNVKGIKYSRYNVIDRIVENSNTRKGQCIKYQHFLDVRMVYDIIQSILQNVNLYENSCALESKVLSGNKHKENDLEKGTQDMTKSSASADRRPSQKDAMLNISNEERMQNGNVLILCNQSMTNNTRGNVNSISLIIAMCYLMYTKKYDPNVTIAYVLRINNNLSISAQTLNFLYKFHASLKRYDYNLDLYYSHETKRKMDKKCVTTCNQTDATSNESCKTEEAEQETQLGKYNSTLRQIIENPGFMQLIRSYRFENPYITISNANECILPINRLDLFENMHLMNEMIKKGAHISYQNILQSLLVRIHNNNVAIHVDGEDNEVNLYEISNVLDMAAKIMADKKVKNPRKMPYFSLITINLCKSLSLYENNEELHFSEGTTEETLVMNPLFHYEMLKYNLFDLICINIEECIKYIMSCNLRKRSPNKAIDEYRISINIDANYLHERNIDQDCYLMFLSLRYLLNCFLYYCMYPTFRRETNLHNEKVTNLLTTIDHFAEYYYSVFNVNINVFRKNDYKAQICSCDKLPLHFKDILRPFLIINNHV